LVNVYQINVEANFGSTGKIAEALGKQIISDGGRAFLAHGRKHKKSSLETIRVGHLFSFAWHLIISRLFDGQGKGSYFSTKRLIKHLSKVKPDIIHLHNIHGYYINYKLLFDYLNKYQGKIVWTLHDCWAFTGHCTHFELHHCLKWQTECHHCPAQKDYPANYGFDFSRLNFKEKKEYFTKPNIHLVPVSNWLSNLVKQSFLNKHNSTIITNGIDLEKFKPQGNLKSHSDKKLILGVASVWTKSKGFEDFIELSKLLNEDEEIVLIGLNQKQKAALPKGILGVERTSSVNELIEWYSKADCFFNLTHADSYPTTIMEAMACGTPVISYAVGGCTEMLNDTEIGCTVPTLRIELAIEAFRDMMKNTSADERLNKSRNHALEYFSFENQIEAYVSLYKSILK